jgi:hypothetical protein
MKAEIKFYNTETVLNTIMSQDWLQPTAVYASHKDAWTSHNMPELVITYPRFVYMKVISDGKNSFSVTELVSRFSSYLVKQYVSQLVSE